MKTIEIKQTEIKMHDEDENTSKKADYADLIKVALNQPKPGGYDYSDIENRIAITKAISERENGSIKLEDAHYKFLKTLIDTMRWPFWHGDILKFKEDI